MAGLCGGTSAGLVWDTESMVGRKCSAMQAGLQVLCIAKRMMQALDEMVFARAVISTAVSALLPDRASQTMTVASPPGLTGGGQTVPH